jgi:hypothetical protein
VKCIRVLGRNKVQVNKEIVINKIALGKDKRNKAVQIPVKTNLLDVLDDDLVSELDIFFNSRSQVPLVEEDDRNLYEYTT